MDHYDAHDTTGVWSDLVMSFRVGEMYDLVEEAINVYIELEAALPPKQGKDLRGDQDASHRKPTTKIHAPIPVDLDTVEWRARVREALRQGQRLRDDARTLAKKLEIYRGLLHHVVQNPYDEPETAIGPCHMKTCDGTLRMAGADLDRLTCDTDDSHTIPRSMWSVYWERKIR